MQQNGNSTRRRWPRTCEACGTAFLARTDQIKSGGGRFCSLACYGRRSAIQGTLEERFWAALSDVPPDGCWLWQEERHPEGYGLVYDPAAKHSVRAHRLAWTLLVGPIPADLNVLHDCPGGDNPQCVNPAHLWLGTHQENVADRVRKGRSAMGERSGNAKLTEGQVRRIRWQRTFGATLKALGDEYGVDMTTIALIVKGKHWKHVL